MLSPAVAFHAPGERERAATVAVLADVHGNSDALGAVLHELERDPPDIVVFNGDLTWGPFPQETLALARRLGSRALFVRGNADRELIAFHASAAAGRPLDAVPAWMVQAHALADRDLIGAFRGSLVLGLEGLGPTRFCHGSPRSDEELVTAETPAERMRALLEGVEEPVVVTAHTHVRYDRRLDGTRCLNPGSVGLPYEGRPGAYWALLGRDVAFRRTEYDVERTAARWRASSHPLGEELAATLLEPPTPEEVIEHAERLCFSG